jgi:hypothetical protein
MIRRANISNSFCRSIKNKRLLAFMNDRFEVTYTPSSTYLWQQEDKIEKLVIACTGKAVFIRPRYNRAVFGAVDTEDSLGLLQYHKSATYS